MLVWVIVLFWCRINVIFYKESKMNDEREKIMTKQQVAEEAHALATPLDFENLVATGVLKQIGKSYYTDNIHTLPEHVVKKISSTEHTKKGIKLSFYKETKSIKNLAEKTKKWLNQDV